MTQATAKIGYVVKRYPRFSETFIVNEILAHEAAGQAIEIFSLRPCNDTHFQDRIAKVQAPLTAIGSASPKANLLLNLIRETQQDCPDIWDIIRSSPYADAIEIHQAIALAQHVRDREITHLHAHFATTSATVARLAAAIAGIPYSLTAHAKDIFHDSVIADDLHQKLSDAAGVVTVSRFNVDYLRSTFPNSAPIHLVYNGLDLEQFTFRSAKDRRPNIIAVGRLVEKKGFDDLIRACRIMRDRNLEFSCQIVGGGELESQLRAQIDELGVADCVELVGPVPQAQLGGMLHEAAVMAAPCVVGDDGNRDGLPTVLLEAMAVGTPCVATDVTGIPEVIQDGTTGIVVPQRSPAQLAEALTRLIQDAASRQLFAMAARQLIEDKFDCHKTSAELRKLFSESVVRQPQATGAI